MAAADKPQPFRGPAEMASTGATDEEEIAAARAANRFDIRRIIGALFVLYGIVLTVTGIVGSHAVKTKAAGINIDLWTGLAMLLVGVLMIAWALLRPTVPEPRRRAARVPGESGARRPPSAPRAAGGCRSRHRAGARQSPPADRMRSLRC